MRVGPILPLAGSSRLDAVRAVVEVAERRGYDSLWTPAHIAIPASITSRYPYSADGKAPWTATTPWGDAFIGLAYAAALTTRVRLGTSVIPLTISDPLTIAKQAATLDVLSGGRFELGIGAGWLVEEAKALGRPTDHRSERLAETIQIVRRAFTEDVVSFAGKRYAFDEVGIHPHPPQGANLPIWIGGHGKRALEIAARHGCGMLLWLASPDEVAACRTALRALGADVPVGAAMALNPTDGRWLELARAYRDAGTSLLILTGYGRPNVTEALERFAEGVLPKLD